MGRGSGWHMRRPIGAETPTRDSDGIAKMLQILTLRFPEWQQVMSKAVVEHLANIVRLFDHSLVLNYQNGEIWYSVSPLVRECV